MAEPEHPQTYLITPPVFELSPFLTALSEVLDTCPVACLRLAMASHDEDAISRAADALREVAHARDVALVIDTHVVLAQRLGLDGVHLLDGARTVRYARKLLEEDAIVGAFCGITRHDGMSAAEAGADYVAFGPAGVTPLGDGAHVDFETFQWWSEMIEIPVVAEGALDLAQIRTLAPHVDFFGLGEEIWSTDNAAQTLKTLQSAMLP